MKTIMGCNLWRELCTHEISLIKILTNAVGGNGICIG